MENKTILFAAVIVIAVAAATCALVLHQDGDVGPDMSYEDDVLVKIYGNANGDDRIDGRDADIIERIVKTEMPDSEWKEKYRFADADRDGKITEKDLKIVRKYIDRESTRLYYQDYWGNDAYINYPLGERVGVDMTYTAQFMGCVGAYEKICGAPEGFSMSGGENYYPGVSTWKSIGSPYGITVESLAASGIDVFVMWSNCLLYTDVWDDAVASGLADRISFVRVDVTGDGTDSGALMLGAMFNTEQTLSKSREYADMISGIRKDLDGIEEKKTVTLAYFYDGATQDSFYLTGGGTVNSFWTKKAMAFQPEWDDKGNIPSSYEGLASSVGDTLFCYATAPIGMADKDVESWMSGMVGKLFEGLPPYEAKSIVCFNEYAFAGLAAPVISYIIASVLSYDGFDLEKGMDLLQSYLDRFAPMKADARTGFVFLPEDLFRGRRRPRKRRRTRPEDPAAEAFTGRPGTRPWPGASS